MSEIAIVEIPTGSSFKYEIIKETGTLLLDRAINQSIPYNYGFIVNTLSEDNDPLDVFILTYFEPIHPLTQVKIEILGAFSCTDNGFKDEKIIAKIEGTNFKLTQDNITAISNYLVTYKPGMIKLEGYHEKEEAEKIIREAKERYQASIS